MTFWELELHVFRFETHELCPLAEEFNAVLGFPLYCSPIVPTSSKHLSVQYCHLLGIGLDDVYSIVIDEEVDFVLLMAHFLKERSYALEGLHA